MHIQPLLAGHVQQPRKRILVHFPPGYDGDLCDNNIDDCTPGICQNGGICTDLVADYQCGCVPGYDGDNCENNINECADTPCKNGGTCTDGVNTFSCNCVPGFTGPTCLINTNECLSNPCQNGATCVDGINGFTCTCPTCFSGTRCTRDRYKECDLQGANACYNGGTCVDPFGPDRRGLCNIDPVRESSPSNFVKEHPYIYACNCFVGFWGDFCENCPAAYMTANPGAFCANRR